MTAIRQAFLKAFFTSEAAIPNLLGLVERSLQHAPKPSRDTQRGWSTNITFRTYNALKNQGVLE
jgi:hypothetical protein